MRYSKNRPIADLPEGWAMPPADPQHPLPLAGKETRAFTPGRGAVLVGGLAGLRNAKKPAEASFVWACLAQPRLLWLIL